MSDEKAKDVSPKQLSKELLTDQIAEAKRFIEYAQQQITTLTQQAQQQAGVLGFAEHLLKTFDIPSIPKKDPKKPELEVK